MEKIEWKVMPEFHDELIWPASVSLGVETVLTLGQGLSNGTHRLVLSGDAKSTITAIRVYGPSLHEGAVR